MSITTLDRAEFAIRRLYNRTIGKYIFSWDHNGPTIFGYCFILKSTVDQLNSLEARQRIRSTMTVDEYREYCTNVELIQDLPRPGSPDGTFTDRQKLEHNISLVGNLFYMYPKN